MIINVPHPLKRRLSGLSEVLQRELLARCLLKTLSKGETFWRMGETPRGFGVLTRGLMELVRPLAGENSASMGIFGPSDCLGVPALLKGKPYPISSLASCSGTQVAWFEPLPGVAREKWPPELSAWLQVQFQEYEETLRDKIDALSARNAEERMSEYLRSLSRRFGEQSSKGGIFIPLSVSKTMLARIVDIRTETAIRIARSWEKAGVIVWEDSGIRVTQATDSGCGWSLSGKQSTARSFA